MGWHNEITSQRSPGSTPGSRGEGRARVREGQGRRKEEERRRRGDRKDRRVDQRLDQDRRLRWRRVEHDQPVQRGRHHGRPTGRREHRRETPAVRPCAEEEIRDFLRGAHVVFITAGMGGGTGTGSAQYVARVAKEEGALTMGVVTMPFKSEGRIRMENAEAGLDKLRKFSDTTIVIYNDKLLELVPRLPINAAFKVADEILMQSIKGMTEIITKPGLVNLDYADLMTIMKGGGVAMIGIGESEEERDRIDYAINEALESPLLGEVDLNQARFSLVRVVGGPDLTLSEAENAAEIVCQKINPQARIIWGCSVEDDLQNTVRVLLVITGVKSKSLLGKDVYTGLVKTSAEVDEVR